MEQQPPNHRIFVMNLCSKGICYSQLFREGVQQLEASIPFNGQHETHQTHWWTEHLPEPVRAEAKQWRPPRNTHRHDLSPFDVETIYIAVFGEDGRAAANPTCTLINSCITDVLWSLRGQRADVTSLLRLSQLKTWQFMIECQPKQETKQNKTKN